MLLSPSSHLRPIGARREIHLSETKFLTTKEIGVSIEKIIKEANDYLFIISPYLRIDGNIRRYLTDASALEGVNIHLVYRKDKEKKGELGSEEKRERESQGGNEGVA